MAEKYRFIFDNKWRKGNIYDQSDEHPQFPSYFTQLDTKELFWRHPDKPNGHPSMYASNDLGEPYEINFISLLDHNFDSNATITLYGADDEDFLINQVSRTIPWNYKNIYNFFIPFTKKYLKIEIANPANLADYLKLATIFAAKSSEINRRAIRGRTRGWQYNSEGDFSTAQVYFSQIKKKIPRRTYPFANLNDNSIDIIFSMLDECGTEWAIILCEDYKNPNSSSYFGYIVDPVDPEIQFTNSWLWQLILREVI